MFCGRVDCDIHMVSFLQVRIRQLTEALQKSIPFFLFGRMALENLQVCMQEMDNDTRHVQRLPWPWLEAPQVATPFLRVAASVGSPLMNAKVQAHA